MENEATKTNPKARDMEGIDELPIIALTADAFLEDVSARNARRLGWLYIQASRWTNLRKFQVMEFTGKRRIS